MAVFGRERFPTLHAKAAAYCFSIVGNHPFFDGNKRTGLATATEFLLSNGLTPEFDEDRMYEAIVSVARGELDVERLAEVFREALTGSAS